MAGAAAHFHVVLGRDRDLELGLDLVVVSSPMTAETRALRLSPDGAFRAACRVLLQRESAHVRRRGSVVVLIEPVVDNLAPMGRVVAGMDYSRRSEVAVNVYESMCARLEHGALAAHFAPWFRGAAKSG